jgi:ATP-dependent 26S proteasome regulatory subunit
VDLEAISKKTDNYTGAHIKELVVTAAINAIDEKSLTIDGLVILKAEHFNLNIDKVRNKKIEPVLGFQTSNSNQDSSPMDDFD